MAWALAQASSRAGEALAIEEIAGTLAGGARVHGIRFTGEDIEVRILDAEIALSPLSLLQLKPRIKYLRAAEIAVVTKPGERRDKPPDSLALPADFRVVEAHVARLTMDFGDGPKVFENVRLSYSGGRTQHVLTDASIVGFGYRISAEGSIDASAPFALRAAVKVAHAARDARADLKLDGNLTDLEVSGSVSAEKGRGDFTAVVRPFEHALPLVSVKVKAAALDLSSLMDTLPQTRLSLDVALKRDGVALSGPIRVENALPGPYDKQRLPLRTLRAHVSTNLKVAGFTSLEADFGDGGTISGSGDVTAEHAVLMLQLKSLNLHALHSKMHATVLGGTAEVKLTEARQQIVTELKQEDIALAFTATRAGEAIEVPRFNATARGGLAEGHAKLNLSGRRPFSGEIRLRRFDPAAWGDFPAGSVNGVIDARGLLSDQTADIRVTLQDSRLLGGTIRGTADAIGKWAEPRVRFDVAAANIAHATYGRARSLTASGAVSLAPQGTMNIQAEASGLVTPQAELRAARIRIEGTRAAHTLIVMATADQIDFRLRAAGGLRGDVWTGTVQELVNRGEVPVQLRSPASLTASRTRARAEPFELTVAGGHLVVSRLAWENGRIDTSGRLANLPVEPLLALAAPAADVRGTLRLSGTWNLSNSPQWTGAVTIRRESGDLTIGKERAFPLRLQEIALDASVGEGAIAFQGRVMSALASLDTKGRVLSTNGGGYERASPLELTAAVDIARMAPFARFIDTPMIIEGEAHARLQGRGTLGDPQLTGPVTARGLAVTLPVEGISVTDGTLDAMLEAKQIRVQNFSVRGGAGTLTARGTLARAAFDTASVDWRAEKFTALARPDRRLVVSGSGNASLEKGKLALTGRVAADEGEFKLGGSTLPTLGTDVVVVGRTPEPAPRDPQAPARTTRAVTLDINVALGNRVHISGQGLDVWLSGDVRLYTSARGEFLARGTVTARNGTFAAYGQRLEIDRGFLYFNGPVTDPALDIVAVRRRLAVEPGVAVTGTLRNPLVRVVSNPPLPQGEALSWLVLGRGPDQAGSGEISALPLAASAIAGKATGSIARALNLDEVGLRGGSAASEQFVTLGKRITDRIYISFEQSVGAAESLLRLEMTLTRRIVLRMQAGETSLFGVFYRFRWD